jgi:hypothetical protein
MKEHRVLSRLILASVTQVQAHHNDMRIRRLIFLSVSSRSSPLYGSFLVNMVQMITSILRIVATSALLWPFLAAIRP